MIETWPCSASARSAPAWPTGPAARRCCATPPPGSASRPWCRRRAALPADRAPPRRHGGQGVDRGRRRSRRRGRARRRAARHRLHLEHRRPRQLPPAVRGAGRAASAWCRRRASPIRCTTPPPATGTSPRARASPPPAWPPSMPASPPGCWKPRCSAWPRGRRCCWWPATCPTPSRCTRCGRWPTSSRVALVLAPPRRRGSRACARAAAARRRPRRAPMPGSRTVRRSIPAARALPLLQALARAGAGRVVLEGLPGLALRLQVGAPA